MSTSLLECRKFYALDEAFAWVGIHVSNVSLLNTANTVIRIPTLKAPHERRGWAILFSDGKVLCGNDELPDRKALVYPVAFASILASTHPEFVPPAQEQKRESPKRRKCQFMRLIVERS